MTFCPADSLCEASPLRDQDTGDSLGSLSQVEHFLEGLASVSEWPSWTADEDNDGLGYVKLMLRPLVVDDFGRHLAGVLAPLDVDDWRRATVTRGFWYQQAAQVRCTCSLHLVCVCWGSTPQC